MTHKINSELIEPRGNIDGLVRVGPIGAELVAHDHEGKTLIEFVLPDRFSNGPTVPFEASWWMVDPEQCTPEDRHKVQELWFIGCGEGEMTLGSDQIEVRIGQAIYIPPDTPHQVRAIGENVLGIFSIWW